MWQRTKDLEAGEAGAEMVEARGDGDFGSRDCSIDYPRAHSPRKH